MTHLHSPIMSNRYLYTLCCDWRVLSSGQFADSLVQMAGLLVIPSERGYRLWYTCPLSLLYSNRDHSVGLVIGDTVSVSTMASVKVQMLNQVHPQLTLQRRTQCLTPSWTVQFVFVFLGFKVQGRLHPQSWFINEYNAEIEKQEISKAKAQHITH